MTASTSAGSIIPSVKVADYTLARFLDVKMSSTGQLPLIKNCHLVSMGEKTQNHQKHRLPFAVQRRGAQIDCLPLTVLRVRRMLAVIPAGDTQRSLEQIVIDARHHAQEFNHAVRQARHVDGFVLQDDRERTTRRKSNPADTSVKTQKLSHRPGCPPLSRQL